MNPFLRQLYLSQLYRNQLQNHFFLRGGSDSERQRDLEDYHRQLERQLGQTYDEHDDDDAAAAAAAAGEEEEDLQNFLSLPFHPVETTIVPYQNSVSDDVHQVDTINFYREHPLEAEEYDKMRRGVQPNFGRLAEIQFVRLMNENLSPCYALTGNPLNEDARRQAVAGGNRTSIEVDLSGADCLLLDITNQNHDQLCEIKRPTAVGLAPGGNGGGQVIVDSQDRICRRWRDYRRLADSVRLVQCQSGNFMRWCCVVVRFTGNYYPLISYITDCSIYDDAIVLTESMQGDFIPSLSCTNFHEMGRRLQPVAVPAAVPAAVPVAVAAVPVVPAAAPAITHDLVARAMTTNIGDTVRARYSTTTYAHKPATILSELRENDELGFYMILQFDGYDDEVAIPLARIQFP